MSPILMAEAFASVLVPVALVAALASDLSRRTIPNVVVVALLLGFAGLSALGMVDDLPLRLVLAGAVLCIGFALFSENVIGAGDAKLAVATALWLDPTQFPLYVLLCGCMGAVLVAAATLARQQGWGGRLARGLPYGVALATSGLALFPYSSLALT